MRNGDLSELESTCKALVAITRGTLSWSWDEGFSGALSKLSSEIEGDVLRRLEEGFQSCWDGSSIAGAPERAQKMAQSLGGLRPGQRLFATSVDSDAIAFGVWWPWNSGTTVSLRVVPTAWSTGEHEQEALTRAFRKWFGLDDE